MGRGAAAGIRAAGRHAQVLGARRRRRRTGRAGPHCPRHADLESATANYGRAIAALIAGDDDEAQSWAARLRDAPDAFARTGEAIAALAAHDDARYAAALEAIVRDFERRSEHLTGVAIADTALMLETLAGRRGMGTGINSPVLPAS